MAGRSRFHVHRQQHRSIGVVRSPALRLSALVAFAMASVSITVGAFSFLRMPLQRHVVARAAAASGVRTDDYTALDLYEVLGVQRTAEPKQVKSAFRSLALKHHPDVAEDEDSGERFREIAYAYDVLSDSKTRGIYDRDGHSGLDRQGVQQSQGNSEMYWDEFKPTKKKFSRKQSARDAAAAFTADLANNGVDDAPSAVVVGAVVEYPLRAMDASAGRTHGVGLLVSRNAERGDVDQLPPEVRTMCEIEPMWQPDGEECSDTGCWLMDELESAGFALEEELRVLPAAYTRGKGTGKPEYWHLLAELSASAGSPDGFLGEEVRPSLDSI